MLGGENMLIGEYQHNIDAKGRVIVPSKLREGLGDKFYIVRGIDRCLFLYPESRWIEILEKIKTLPWTLEEVRKFSRKFASTASECEVDSQGRILIPQRLREYAGLEKAVVSIGVIDRAEIWSRESWEEYNGTDDEDGEDEELARKMAELGI